MRTLVEQLSQYAAYHRDQRNIATHFLGIPMIVVGVIILLCRPGMDIAGMVLSPATLGVIVASLYYLKLDVRLGLTMSLLLGAALFVAQPLAAQLTAVWLGSGVGLFVVGWVLQFIGHYYEGRKPAFVDDLMGLVIGPLFVTAEAAFLLGLRKELQHEIEAIVGPTRATTPPKQTPVA